MGYKHIGKKCGDCQKWKPVTSFYPSRRGTHRRDGYCKKCRRTRDRNRLEQRNKIVQRMKAIDPFYFRRKKLIKMYGITHEQYMQMHKKQKGVCAICKEEERRKLYGLISHLVVDHNHETGTVRALLCCRCNAALGTMENIPLRNKLAAYMEKHNGNSK